MNIFIKAKNIVQRHFWIKRLNTSMANKINVGSSLTDEGYKISIFNGEVAKRLNNFFYTIDDNEIGGVSNVEVVFKDNGSAALKGQISAKFQSQMERIPYVGLVVEVRL